LSIKTKENCALVSRLDGLAVEESKREELREWGKAFKKEAHWQVIEGPPLVLLYCPVVPDSHLAQFWNAHTSFTSSSSFHPSLFLIYFLYVDPSFPSFLYAEFLLRATPRLLQLSADKLSASPWAAQ
jgi:hypothetical protein